LFQDMPIREEPVASSEVLSGSLLGLTLALASSLQSLRSG
jgi:uncharacterized membrane protein YjfL (UPF0719 family)